MDKDLKILELEAKLEELKKDRRIAELEAEIRRLRDRTNLPKPLYVQPLYIPPADTWREPPVITRYTVQ